MKNKIVSLTHGDMLSCLESGIPFAFGLSNDPKVEEVTTAAMRKRFYDEFNKLLDYDHPVNGMEREEMTEADRYLQEQRDELGNILLNLAGIAAQNAGILDAEDSEILSDTAQNLLFKRRAKQRAKQR